MDLRSYIIKVRGEQSLRSFAREHHIPIKTVNTYERVGYLDNASTTILANVCKYYNIDPYKLPDFGIKDEDTINAVLDKLNNSKSKEKDYVIQNFLEQFKDKLNLSDEEPAINSKYTIVKTNDNNNIVLYYLPTRQFSKGQGYITRYDIPDYFELAYDSIQKFVKNEAIMFFFVTSSKALFYSMRNDINNLSISGGELKSGKKSYTSYVVYCRYRNAATRNDIFCISGNNSLSNKFLIINNFGIRKAK